MHDQLLNESLPRLYLRYLIPALLASIGSCLYCLADVYFISKSSGEMGLAALNICMPLFSIQGAIALTFAVGGASLMSIGEGRNDQSLRNKGFSYAIIAIVVIGLIMSLCGIIFPRQCVMLLGSDEALLNNTLQYFIPINAGHIFFMMHYGGPILLRNDHAPKLAMVSSLLSNFINIFLDYLFCMKLNMGIQGASIATALSVFIGFIFMLTHFILKHNSVHFTFKLNDYKVWKSIIISGIGSGVIEISVAIITLVFNYLIMGVANAIFLSAYAIITNVTYVCKGLLNGFAQAVQPIVSVNYGANKNNRVKGIVKLGCGCSIILALIIYIMFIFFASNIAQVFAQDIEAISIATKGIRLYFISLVFTAFLCIILIYFQSSEKGKWAMLLSLLKGFVFIALALIILFPIINIDAIWLAVPFAEILTTIIVILLFKKIKIE